MEPTFLTPEEAAAYWLLQRDGGVAIAENPRFQSWLGASTTHALVWKNAVSVWDSFDGETDPLLEAMREQALVARRPSSQGWDWLRVAASIALLVVAGLAGWQIIGGKQRSLQLAQFVPPGTEPTFVAAVGPHTFTLPDGSLVTLNSGSALAVRYTAQRRAVRLLRGQAFFKVAHDSARPFTTDAASTTITNLGTEFDVLMGIGSVSVTLASGSVAVSTENRRGPRVLKPGEQLETTPGKNDQIKKVDLEDVLAWHATHMELHDEPLENVIARFNRYGGAPVRIVDPSIASIRVSGRFRTGDPSRFAKALAEIYPVRVVQRPDGGYDITKQ